MDRRSLCLVAAGSALVVLGFLAEAARAQTPGTFVARSGVGYWVAPASGSVTRPEQNTWRAQGSGFVPTAGRGLWIPASNNVRDPKANTWGPTTGWVPARGRGFWFTPYSGTPRQPRAARWQRAGSTGPWVSLRGPGIWVAPSSGPTRPQDNTWGAARPTSTR